MTNGRKVRNLIIGRVILAAVRMNDRSLRRVATPDFAQMQHLWCCERAQQESDTSGVGSFGALAALRTKVRYARQRRADAAQSSA